MDYLSWHEIEQIWECITQLPLLQIVLAHLAKVKFYRIRSCSDQLSSIYQDYFAKCQHQLEELKKVIVYESVTLYKLLTENPNRIVHCALNCEFSSTFKAAVRKMGGEVHSYYYHVLHRRVCKAIKRTELKIKAAVAVQKLTGFHIKSHRIIVSKIVGYLNDQDLKDLCCQEQVSLLIACSF